MSFKQFIRLLLAYEKQSYDAAEILFDIGSELQGDSADHARKTKSLKR
jgi:hypothetical protein